MYDRPTRGGSDKPAVEQRKLATVKQMRAVSLKNQGTNRHISCKTKHRYSNDTLEMLPREDGGCGTRVETREVPDRTHLSYITSVFGFVSARAASYAKVSGSFRAT